MAQSVWDADHGWLGYVGSTALQGKEVNTTEQPAPDCGINPKHNKYFLSKQHLSASAGAATSLNLFLIPNSVFY